MKPTRPGTIKVTRQSLVELLEPVIANALEANEIAFSEPTARRLLRSLCSIAARLYFHSGGSFKGAVTEVIHGVRIGRQEAEKVEAYVGVTQKMAKA